MVGYEVTLVFLSDGEVETSVRWLIENASPPVQYLVHKHILKTDPQSEPMQELWRSVESSGAAEEIFSRQSEDGSWFSGGPWGPKGYRQQTGRGSTPSRPKFVTTAWLLPYLGEMGFSVADELSIFARHGSTCFHLYGSTPWHDAGEIPGGKRIDDRATLGSS